MQSNGVMSGPIPGLRVSSQRLVVIILLASLTITLIYVRSLIYYNPPPFIFYLAHLLSVVAIAVILVKPSKLSYFSQTLLVLLWVLTMRMLIPFRLPEGIITNYPDMIYELQIIHRIASTGSISFTGFTTYAQGYIFTPVLETFIVIFSTVLGIPFETALKYAGPFFGVFTIAFLLGFYRAFLNNREAIIAAFLAGSCFWFIRFDATTVHQPLALAFLALALYSLTKSGTPWKFVTALSVFATVSTHEFTAIVSSVFFIFAALGIFALSRSFGIKRGPVENAMMKMPGLMLTMTFAWLAFIALPFFATTIGFADYVGATLLSGNAPLAFPLTPSKSIPTSWDRVVGDVGVVFFAVSCCVGFLAALMSRGSARYKEALPYAASSALLFFLGLISYLKFNQATDLLSRGFLYIYFFSAPIAVLAILKISGSARRRVSHQQLLTILLICIIVLSGIYYNYPRSFHDNTAPGDIEDVRFPLFQWKSAGYFALNHTGLGTLWGDKIAFNYVGGYGEKDVQQLDRTLNITLVEWMSAYPSPGDIVILRKSMVTVPFWNYEVSSNGFHEILATNNIVYSSGEVIMLVES